MNSTIKNKNATSRAADIIFFSIGLLLIAFLIQTFGKIKGDAIVFPSVIQILKTFFHLLIEPKTYILILTSIFHLVAALFFSVVIGIFLGVCAGLCEPVYKILTPLMTMLRSIPMIILVIIIMVLADYSLVPCIAASLALIPLISEGSCAGLRAIDSDLIAAYRLYSNLSPRILFSVYLPLMQGYLRQAFINAVGMGMKIVITSEYLVQTKNSLGKAVFTSNYFNEYEEIYAYALIMILLVVALNALPILIQKIKLKIDFRISPIV